MPDRLRASTVVWPRPYSAPPDNPPQQVEEKTGSIHPDRWSVQYTGTASFVQVKGLRPGRRYAARVLVQPTVTNLLEVVVAPPPPSEVVAVETLPCAPMGQPAPQLASRAKKELKARAGRAGLA